MIDVKSLPRFFSVPKKLLLPRLFRIITHWKMGLKAKPKLGPEYYYYRHQAHCKVHYSNECFFRFFLKNQSKISGDGVLYCRMHLFYGLTMPCFKMSRYVTLSLRLLTYLMEDIFCWEKIYCKEIPFQQYLIFKKKKFLLIYRCTWVT